MNNITGLLLHPLEYFGRQFGSFFLFNLGKMWYTVRDIKPYR